MIQGLQATTEDHKQQVTTHRRHTDVAPCCGVSSTASSRTESLTRQLVPSSKRCAAAASSGRSWSMVADDGMGSLEVTGATVAHPETSTHEMSGSRSNSSEEIARTDLPDLDEADVYGVEDQPVVERATTEVIADRFNRGQDVLEPLVVSPAHNGIASASTCSRMPGSNESAGTLHVDADIYRSRGRGPPGRPTPHRCETDEQVDVTLLGLVPACHAAEHRTCWLRAE